MKQLKPSLADMSNLAMALPGHVNRLNVDRMSLAHYY